MKLSEEGFKSSCEGLKRDTIILIAWTHYSKVAKLEDEIKALRKLAHDYIQAYEKLAFGDASGS